MVSAVAWPRGTPSSVPALTQGSSFRVSWRGSERAPLGEMGSHGKLSFFQPFCSRRSGGPAWTPGRSSGGLCRTEGVLRICRFWSCQGHRGEALSCCCGHIWAKSPPFPFHSPASLSCSVKVSVYPTEPSHHTYDGLALLPVLPGPPGMKGPTLCS